MPRRTFAKGQVEIREHSAQIRGRAFRSPDIPITRSPDLTNPPCLRAPVGVSFLRSEKNDGSFHGLIPEFPSLSSAFHQTARRNPVWAVDDRGHKAGLRVREWDPW